MKRPIIFSLILWLLAAGANPAGAQVYDDIYYTPADAQQDAVQQAKEHTRDSIRYAQQRGNAQEDQNSGGYYRGDEYVDYDNDYYYATNISRFNRPFYNMGFYSTFYNPFWYDPYWVDPYWGWSPWIRPGISISFGSPYWTSYGGWYSWYGYPGFYSSWSYPYYAGGWGYGGYGYNAGYYNGYWNGYYAGLYGSGGGYRTTSYGPRYTLNTAQNSMIRTNANNIRGFRSNAIRAAENPRAVNAQGVRNNTSVRPGVSENPRVQPNSRQNEIRSSEMRNNEIRQTPDRNLRNNEENIRNNDIRNNEIRRAPDRPQPGRFETQPAPGRRIESTPRVMPQPQRNTETPRYQPRIERSAPVRQAPEIRQAPVQSAPQAPVRTYEAPSRSYNAPAAPSRSYNSGGNSGGSIRSSGGSGGGGGGGGYRR